ncbi:MAG TPA: hypothetical protein VK501_09165 [Baekduia sp.]|uniref:hypothetical protein n=1 Tax=Baekduia sp. TaxID=2600305 RepID=UPI002CEF05FA|nr:hypothetical protein [Baekduia sp.]HMJ34077.1 hypothetical protein [Baekduia sp.]
MKHKILGLLIGGLTLAATTSSAFAASVSVEIEGQTVQSSPTTVTTPGHVTKPGGVDCDGTTIVGALEAFTGGDWAGSAYTVDTIKGESHPFGPGGSWSFYLNGRFVNDSGCAAAVKDGDKVVFFWSGAFADAGYGEPVLLDAPAALVPGRATAVTVTETSTYFGPTGFDPGVTTITPSAGASVAGGTATATSGADGTAQVTVAPGPYTLLATKGNRAPARISGCATTGSDGFCGSTAAGGTTIAPAPPCVTRGDDGLCGSPDKRAANAAFTALPEGKKYKKGKGPRQLAGRVADEPSGIADVRIRITRTNARACSTFDGRTERFVAMKKCGATHGRWFSVGAKSDFTYLLPSRLGPGRFVLDLQVVDKAGNKTAALARGTSRVVFTVA